MARSRKKSIGQHVVGVATLGLPSPVQKVARTRWGSRIFLLVAALLFSAGIINVQWKDGRPQLKVDQERAKEVKKNIVSEIESVEARQQDQNSKFRWIDHENKPAESGLIRDVFGNGESQPNSTNAPFLPRLGSAGEATGHFPGFSAKPAPQSNENSRPTKLPWLR